jgi:UDP-N-acetylglucosamine 4,6-dehydratase
MAIAPQTSTRVVGVRPGEKLHEVMCPADDSHLTLEFVDHYVITPSIQFIQPVAYRRNALGESGESVPDGFEYNSGTNPWFLTVDELRKLVTACD